MDENADNPPRLLNADARVATDLPCIKCGYNLRTLAADARCPECAYPVRHSLSGLFLRFASPEWVRQLARGALLLIIAVGVFAAGQVFILTPLQGLLPYTTPTGSTSPSFMLVGSLDQFVFRAGIIALMMVALWTITKPNPATRLCAEGLTARRLLRVCACLLPVPLVLGLLTQLCRNTMIAIPPPPSRLPVYAPTFLALAISCGVTSVLTFVLTPLALLSHLGGLMKRVPRPGLARLCRIGFWIGLIPGVALLAGYAWTILFVVVPMATARWTTVGQMTVPTQPPIDPAFTVAWYLSSIGGHAILGLVCAGLILLFFVQRALAQAARKAAENAAIVTPVTPAPA